MRGDVYLDGCLFADQVFYIPGDPFQVVRFGADGCSCPDVLSVNEQTDGRGGTAETQGPQTADEHVDIWFGNFERAGGQGSGEGIVVYAFEVGRALVSGCVSALAGTLEHISLRSPVVQAMLEVFDDAVAAAREQEGRAGQTGK